MSSFIKILGLIFLAGLLLALAHPYALPFITYEKNYILDTGVQEILAWVGLIPFLFAMKPLRGWKAFWAAFGFSMFYFALSIYWINIAVVLFGNISPFISFVIFTALIVAMSVVWGLGFLVSFSMARKSRLSLAITLPVAFVFIEMFRNYLFFNGFPWQILAYSQYKNIPFLQTSALWSVYGMTMILVLSNVVLYQLIEWRRGKHEFPRIATAVLVFLVAFSYAYGIYRISANEELEKNSPKFKAAMIQGNIEQNMKNNSYKYANRIIDVYQGLSAQMPDDTELVIWPEASFPYNMMKQTKDLKRTFRPVWPDGLPWPMLIGVVTYEYKDGTRKFYNSAMMLEKDFNISQIFDKSHLVPFGEYVPLGDILKVKKIIPEAGMFYPGDSLAGMTLGDVKFGILICYEGIFPEITREYTKSEVDFLINVTNDAWYGVSSAPYQHLAFYTFRAVEARKAIFRAANTGFSAVIDTSGRISRSTDLFTRTGIVASLPKIKERTIYSYIGDYPFWACVLIWCYWAVLTFTKEKKIINK